MNDLAITGPVLAERAEYPPMTASLRWHAEHEPESWRPASPGDVHEAKRVIGQIEQLCAPPTPGDQAWRSVVLMWLGFLAANVRNPPARDDLLKRVVGVMAACAGLPRAMWTAETATEAVRRFPWWPAAADVHDLLAELARPMLALRRGIRRVAAIPLPAPETAREPVDLAYVKAQSAAIRAELAAMSKGDDAPRPRPSRSTIYLDNLDTRARAGDGEARREAAEIRRQMRDGSLPAPARRLHWQDADA